MKPTLNHNIKSIQSIEKLIFTITDFDVKTKYLNPSDNLFIKHLQWPFQAFQLFSKVTGINAFPDKNLKNWFQVFKKKGRGFNKRIGLFLRIPFIHQVELPIYADVYFNKDYFGILLYLNHAKPKVVKFSQLNGVEVCDKLKQEANALKLANKIHHKNVSTPSLLSFFSNDTITYFEQDLIFANDLHALPKATQIAIYHDVFDFMYLVYQQAGINLISPKVEDKKTDEYIEGFLMNFDEGSFVISKYKKLMEDNKLMFSGKIHGDLIFNNILFNKKNKQIWIIDWGESSTDYLAKDFFNQIECAKLLFQKVIDDLKIDKNSIYKIEDQIFLSCYDKIVKLVDNHLIRDKVDSHFKSKIQTTFQLMKSL